MKASLKMDRRGVAPAISVKSDRFKMTTGPHGNSRPWEKRIIQAPKFFYPQIMDPIRHDLPDLVPYREKVGGEGLAEFRLHLAGVLFHFPSIKSICFSFIEAMAPSRAPVSSSKAINVRLRRSISVPLGMVEIT